MEKVAVELEANVDDAIKNVDRLNVSIKNVGSSSKKSSKELSAGAQIGNEGVKALDRGTKGLASAFVKVGKASKLSGKAMKSALISSGIGLAVVAISLIVEYWDDISETLGFVNRDLERQLELNKSNASVISSEIILLQTKIKLNKEKNIDNTENLKALKKARKEKLKIIASDIESNKLLKQKIIDENILLNIYGDVPVDTSALNEFDAKINKLKGDALELKRLLNPVPDTSDADNARKNAITKWKNARNNALKEIRKNEEDYANSKLEEEVREKKAVTDKYADLIAKAKKYNEDTTLLEKAQKEELQTITDDYATKAEEKEKESERKKVDAIESIRKQLIDTEAEERAEKLRLIQEDYAEQIRLAELYYADDTEKKKELEAAQKLALDAQKLKWKEEDAAKELADKEAKAALELEIQEAGAVTEEEKRLVEIAKVEARYARFIKIAKDAGISTVNLEKAKVAAIAKINESEVEIAELTAEGKLDIAGQALGQIATMVDKESAAGKGIAIAQTGISTAKGIVNALATSGPPWIGIAMASIVGAMGLMNTQKIISTKIPSASGKGNVSGGGASAGSLPAMPSVPPAFNIVGSSDTNQLADAIGGQSQTPVQAYVVSNDVSTAMELDRNIINGASIG